MNYKRLIISLSLPQLAGIIGSVFTAPSISTWYAALAKPELSPPNWLFGPVWVTLYFFMGIAAFLVWSSHSKAKGGGQAQKRAKIALGIFGGQLVLNALWSIIFFGFRNPFWAFIEIIILWLAIFWTIIVFYRISRPAAYLLLPYILWVSFASYLNYFIWALN